VRAFSAADSIVSLSDVLSFTMGVCLVMLKKYSYNDEYEEAGSGV